MNVIVLVKMVADTVEDIAISADGKSVDADTLRLKLSEPDDHALEQAVLLKEQHGGTVTVVALDSPDIDEVLFTALAKGVDRAVKISGDWTGIQAPAIARVFHMHLTFSWGGVVPDTLILCGSQAIDDLEGEVGPYLAHLLNLPYLGVIAGVTLEAGKVVVNKDMAGGVRGQFEMPLPCVLGILTAEKPPRYVPIAKVRASKKTASIETQEGRVPGELQYLVVERVYMPEVARRAQFLEGTAETVADSLVGILADKGII